MVNTKRAYERAERADGFQVLVDRLWPRGATKHAAHVDLWAKDVVPSPCASRSGTTATGSPPSRCAIGKSSRGSPPALRSRTMRHGGLTADGQRQNLSGRTVQTRHMS